jgi:lipoate-protein ligase A
MNSRIATKTSAWTLRRLSQCPKESATQEPFLCFARRACGDVLIADHEGKESKLLGSAQRRHRGAILQHGSLLLERSPFAPELDGWLDLTGAEVSVDAVISSLTVPIANALKLRTITRPFPVELQSKAEELANNKYGSPAWTKRR